MSMDDRLAAALWARPELASMNMGSLNFNISGAGARITEWKHPWEKAYVEGSVDFIMSNTFAQVERGLRELGDNGTRFEFECYDMGHLYNLAHFLDRGLVKPPLFVQGVFGILGGIAAEPTHLIHFSETATRLFGQDHVLSALAAGRHQMPMITLSAILGGNVRVGLEDSLFLGRGTLAKSSAEQVRSHPHHRGGAEPGGRHARGGPGHGSPPRAVTRSPSEREGPGRPSSGRPGRRRSLIERAIKPSAPAGGRQAWSPRPSRRR